MRNYLFRGMRKDNGEWAYGGLDTDWGLEPEDRERYWINQPYYGLTIVAPESIGQYTGMNEFVMSDRSFNKPLFEGDIVEVWGMRRPYNSTNPQSQYDGWMKVRAVIQFERGQWILNDKNKYNESLTKLKGKEEDDRSVDCSYALSWYGYHCNSENEEWHREHNKHYKYGDIVRIGTVFENSELLEG